MNYLWMFPESPLGLEPEFWDRLSGLQRRVGPQDLHVVDGYREFAAQEQLRQNIAKQGLNPDEYYAPPGGSSHNYGLGADLLGNLQDAHRYAPNYGLFFPEKNDPWHIEPAYVTQKGIPAPDESTAAQLAVQAAIREGRFDEQAQIQALRAQALQEGQAERFNVITTKPEERNADRPMAGGSVASTGGEGQTSAVKQITGTNAEAVATLKEQQALDQAMAAAAPPPASGPGGVGAPGPAKPVGGTGWSNIDAFLQANGVKIGPATKGQTDGGSHAPGSYHYQGTARDYGTAGSDPAAIYNLLVPIAQNPEGPIAELFWDPSGAGWKNGKNIGPIGGHSDHVHVALKPGRSLAEVGGAAVPAAGPARVTVEEATVDPAWQMAILADVHKRGAEKTYARAVPIEPLAKTPSQDLVSEAQGGRKGGETLAPGAHETPAGLAEIAASVMEGNPVRTQEKPPPEEVQAPEQQPDQAAAQGGDAGSWLDQVAAAEGLTPQEKMLVAKAMQRESGGRNIPQQVNDINMQKGTPAFGPLQIIKPTFDRYADPGWDWHNPVQSMRAAVRYARARYGAGWAARMARSGY